MIKLYENGIYLVNGETICSCPEEVAQKSGRATIWKSTSSAANR